LPIGLLPGRQAGEKRGIKRRRRRIRGLQRAMRFADEKRRPVIALKLGKGGGGGQARERKLTSPSVNLQERHEWLRERGGVKMDSTFGSTPSRRAKPRKNESSTYPILRDRKHDSLKIAYIGRGGEISGTKGRGEGSGFNGREARARRVQMDTLRETRRVALSLDRMQGRIS